MLVHFEAGSVHEAVKMIKKMSQRDLQAKFRLVYGAKTFSNNNNWWVASRLGRRHRLGWLRCDCCSLAVLCASHELCCSLVISGLLFFVRKR